MIAFFVWDVSGECFNNCVILSEIFVVVDGREGSEHICFTGNLIHIDDCEHEVTLSDISQY